MMGWLYDLKPLTQEALDLRRVALDRYAFLAFASSLLPVIVFLIIRFVQFIVFRIGGQRDNQGHYAEIPRSPLVKAQRVSGKGQLGIVWRKFAWWMQDEIRISGSNWGTKDEWILGSLWTLWLLTLCIMGTGTDYFHLTKRFGIIATSQFPIQYLLSLKAINPVAFAFNTSHEVLNRYHRLVGRIIYSLIVLHMAFYLGFFMYAGILLTRPFAPVVFCGVVASILIHALAGTAMAAIRNFSYRIFFITHLVAVIFVPVLIFFHAASARWYITASFILFLADIIVRKARTVSAPSVIEAIPGTNLIKVTASLPADRIEQFRAAPGSHLYLNLPSEARTASTSPIFELLYNPFTVASFSDDNEAITLILRTRSGPVTTAITALAAASSASTQTTTKIPLSIEGPYGTMKSHLSSLLTSGTNRVLLIAGGVGATFALPIYNHLVDALPLARLQFVWAVPAAGDATWAISTGGKSLLEDSRLQLFLTGAAAATTTPAVGDNVAGVELDTMTTNQGRRGVIQKNRKRPDLQKIIDEAFRLSREDTVAILVCGPEEMNRDARAAVRPWVMKGRNVWWHSEQFGW